MGKLFLLWEPTLTVENDGGAHMGKKDFMEQ